MKYLIVLAAVAGLTVALPVAPKAAFNVTFDSAGSENNATAGLKQTASSIAAAAAANSNNTIEPQNNAASDSSEQHDYMWKLHHDIDAIEEEMRKRISARNFHGITALMLNRLSAYMEQHPQDYAEKMAEFDRDMAAQLPDETKAAETKEDEEEYGDEAAYPIPDDRTHAPLILDADIFEPHYYDDYDQRLHDLSALPLNLTDSELDELFALQQNATFFAGDYGEVEEEENEAVAAAAVDEAVDGDDNPKLYELVSTEAEPGQLIKPFLFSLLVALVVFILALPVIEYSLIAMALLSPKRSLFHQCFPFLAYNSPRRRGHRHYRRRNSSDHPIFV